MAGSFKNRYNPHFYQNITFKRPNIWNIFGNKFFPVLSNSKFVWFFNFTQNLSGMVMPPCPGKCLQEYGKILIALFLGRQTLKSSWISCYYSQFPNIRGGGDISTFLKFWEGGNHLLGPPPYSVFENFGGGVPTFRTPPYSVFEKKIYPFNF